VSESAQTEDDRDTLLVGLLVNEAAQALADELAGQPPERLGRQLPECAGKHRFGSSRPAEPTATTNDLLKTVRRELLDKDWGLGVGLTHYAVLFVVYALGATVFVPTSVDRGEHAIGFGDYLELAWWTASVSLVGGTLGSLVESDDSVRNAADRAHADERKERNGGSDGG
jgi:hypothetical protein